jgi:hypothetical protein
VIRIRRSKYAPYGRGQKGEGETLMISAEVEENTIPSKTVYTRIFMSHLEVWIADITPRLNIKPVDVGVFLYWNEF